MVTSTTAPRHVIAIADHTLDFPELYLNVFVSGPPVDQKGFPFMFTRAQCWKADTPDEADLVVFTGGPDVDPAYYGEAADISVCCSPERDDEDMKLFLHCHALGIPMLGVCRGAQFLAVMAAGCKLYQDINNHHGDHPMWDLREKEMLQCVSSVHHQAIRPNNEIDIIAVTHRSTMRIASPNSQPQTGSGSDIEAFFHRESCSLGFQGHPEYKNYSRYTQWCLKQISDYIVCNPDLSWSSNDKSGRLRMKPELLETRPTGRLYPRPTINTSLTVVK